MPHFYEFDRDILVKLRTQYLLHSHGIYLLFEWKRQKGMSSVKISITDISLDKNLSMRSPDLLTTGIRRRVSQKVKWELWTHGVDIDLNCLHYPLWRWLK